MYVCMGCHEKTEKDRRWRKTERAVTTKEGRKDGCGNDEKTAVVEWDACGYIGEEQLQLGHSGRDSRSAQIDRICPIEPWPVSPSVLATSHSRPMDISLLVGDEWV